jgi:hypothetical protein
MCFLSTASLAFGQEDGFELGLKTGLNNTWIILDNEIPDNEHHDEHFNVKVAPIGISAGYKFNDQTSIMVEGFWSKQGANFDLLNDNGGKVGEKEIKLDYIVVPLLFKFTGEGETRFALQLGAQAAFQIKGEETNTFNQDVNYIKTWNQQPKTILAGKYILSSTESTPNDANHSTFNDIDYNLVADIGMEHDLSETCYLSVGLRLAYGFKDIMKDESITYQFDPDKFTLRYNATGGLHVGLHWFL